ncbi:MAG: hypothetical protein JWO60_3081 [Frankiales bacterium]|nr:hypothetical protein [Frankiales bacterium]
MDEQTNEENGLSRRTALKRGAVIGGALVWTAPVVQTLAGPAFAQTAGSTGIDEDADICGRITGGGQGAAVATDNRAVNYGIGQLFCAVSGFTQAASLIVNYRNVADTKNLLFKLDAYSSVCSGPGSHAGAPTADFNQLDLTGVGTVSNASGAPNAVPATITARFIDNGEGGGAFGMDQVAFNISTGIADRDLVVGIGDVANGNIQAHKADGNPRVVCGSPAAL